MSVPKDLRMSDLKRALEMLEERNDSSGLIGRFFLFGAGLLVGAGLALLLNPLGDDRADEIRGRESDDSAESKQS